MKTIYKNQRGFSHHFILPLLAFIAVGAIGAYVIAKSNAATAGPSDVVYSAQLQAGGDTYYRYSSSAGSSTEYPSDTGQILDVSRDQKWILTKQWQNDGDHIGEYAIVGISSDGQKAVYGYTVGSASCTTDGFDIDDAHFSKVATTGAPTIYYAGVSLTCVNGTFDTTHTSLKLYSMGANGAGKKELSAAIADSDTNVAVTETATNGYVHFYAKGRHYIITPAGKTIFNVSASSYSNVTLSENGKRIAYQRYTGTDRVYVANSDGKKAKKIMSYSDNRMLTGISPTGTYVLYQKNLSKDGTKTGLYSYNVSTKKTKTIDSGYGEKDTYPGALDQEHWLPGSNTFVYTKRDVKAKTMQLVQVTASNSSKKVLVTSDYNTVYRLTVY